MDPAGGPQQGEAGAGVDAGPFAGRAEAEEYAAEGQGLSGCPG